MKIFLFSFEMSVLACLVWEIGAEAGAEIEVGEKVTSDVDYEDRFKNHQDKKLAIFYAISGTITDEDEYKAKAAEEFALHGVKNGVYLVVHLASLSADIKEKYIFPSKDSLVFQWENKYRHVRITDKNAYEKRHEQYNDGVIVTMFHNFEPGCMNEQHQEDCLDLAIKGALYLCVDEYESQAVPVVLLVVHVDLVGKESIKSLCPERGEPKLYPALFDELKSKLFEIHEPGAIDTFDQYNC
ncbi:uncharacterized protein LOC128987924 [Macrosteles quadrilineatus]|uniref:uncharacterized protein LOC128987924 n=1 Tax=Macrosteles quadrilineatus TaxID=74068 RepID=UPI0023E0F706|nr:uncharacterized protein LOC128987924 [Macrosteles quadrilineatus]